jgi:hypothetical protein
MESWLPAVAGAIGAIAAAFVAAVFAKRARESETSAQRFADLEKRLATSKAEIYEPLIEMLRNLFDSTVTKKEQMPETELLETISRFTAWVQIYGSDEVVREMRKFMQVAFHEPPAFVSLRYYAQLVLAIRRDLGDPRTEVNLTDLLAMRITDIYEGEEQLARALSLPEGEFLELHNWTPPWHGMPPQS